MPWICWRGWPGTTVGRSVGTGRVAPPLAARGVEVHGIDMWRAMVERLRTKPGGGGIGVTIGDFATAKVEESFSAPTSSTTRSRT